MFGERHLRHTGILSEILQRGSHALIAVQGRAGCKGGPGRWGRCCQATARKIAPSIHLPAARATPAPENKGIDNWREREANLRKRAENTETCMRVAGYSVTAECSVPLKTYENCMKIADELMRGPSGRLYRDADWSRICLDNEWDVRTQERLSVPCYQPGS